jgi:hypothetical protein
LTSIVAEIHCPLILLPYVSGTGIALIRALIVFRQVLFSSLFAAVNKKAIKAETKTKE